MNSKIASKIKKIFASKGIFLIAIALFLLMSIVSELFLSKSNLLSLMLAVTIYGIAAIGVAFVIIQGGIDLSIGSIISLCGCLSIGFLVKFNLPIAIVLTILVGLLIGCVNGLIIAYGHIEAFIATMATGMIIDSIILVYTDGYPRYVKEGVTDATPDFGTVFTFLGGGKLGGVIPVAFLIFLAVGIVAWIVMSKTVFGRHVYGVGGNKLTAKLCGIHVERTQIICYALCGGISALAGLLYAARVGTALPNMGSGYELKAIAAVAVGGTSLAGGRGGIINTMVGAVIFAILANGLNLLKVSSYYQDAATGLIILVAVILNENSARKKGV